MALRRDGRTEGRGSILELGHIRVTTSSFILKYSLLKSLTLHLAEVHEIHNVT